MNDYIEARVAVEGGKEFGVRGEKVLLELEETPTEIRRGKVVLFVAPSYRKWAKSGTIKSIGEGVNPEQYDIRVGDKIFFGTSMIGVDMEINNIAYKILGPEAILAVMERANV